MDSDSIDHLLDAICFATHFCIEPLHRVFEIGQPVLYLDLTNKTLVEGTVEGFQVSANANRFEVFYEVRIGNSTAKIHPNLLVSSDEVHQYQPKYHDS